MDLTSRGFKILLASKNISTDSADENSPPTLSLTPQFHTGVPASRRINIIDYHIIKSNDNNTINKFSPEQQPEATQHNVELVQKAPEILSPINEDALNVREPRVIKSWRWFCNSPLTPTQINKIGNDIQMNNNYDETGSNITNKSIASADNTETNNNITLVDKCIQNLHLENREDRNNVKKGTLDFADDIDTIEIFNETNIYQRNSDKKEVLQKEDNKNVSNEGIASQDNNRFSECEILSNSEEDPYANSDECSLYVPTDEEDDRSHFASSLEYLNLQSPDNKLVTRSSANKMKSDISFSNICSDDNTFENAPLSLLNNIIENDPSSSSEEISDTIVKDQNINITNTESTTKKIYKRKPDFCYYCEEEVLNYARHVQRNHPMELEVIEIFSKPVNSKERRHLLNKLRRKGNYLKNASDCYKPVRQSYIPNQSLLPCENCLGFFSSRLLFRHRKNCCGSSNKSQAMGQTQLAGSLKIDQRLREEVFPNMRADNISLAVKKDILICAFGARYLKTHREKHFVNVTSRKMRELGRMLLEIKKRNPSIKNLFQALQPQYFDLLVESTKEVACYDTVNDTFGSPTYAMNIVTSLKQCCEIAITYALKRQFHYETVSSAEAEASLNRMIHLLNANWRYEISSQAANNLDLKKWNKITVVPLANDLKLLKVYLLDLADRSIKKLRSDENDKSAYNSLLESIYCRIILLNRKRPGELQRMQLHTYLSINNEKKNYEEFMDVISPTEKILLKNLKRVVIRGKRGRGVPVLFSLDVQEHVNVLLQIRPRFVPEGNLYLFGKPDLLTTISGYKVLQKHAAACGAKHPFAITSTKLRKQLATLSQIFSMNDNELEQLATFMGHTPGVHKSSYRLPDDVYQTAKVSKLLLLMENGNASHFKGKSLNEIEIDMDEDLLEKTDQQNDDESDEDVNENLVFNDDKDTSNKSLHITKPICVRKKRVLVPWTSQQKNVVKDFFKHHIKMKKPPKRVECEELKTRYSDILANKNWLKIKVFIQNEYSKKN